MPDLGVSVKAMLWLTYISDMLDNTVLVAACSQTMVHIAAADTPRVSQLGVMPSTATKFNSETSNANFDCK